MRKNIIDTVEESSDEVIEQIYWFLMTEVAEWEVIRSIESFQGAYKIYYHSTPARVKLILSDSYI